MTTTTIPTTASRSLRDALAAYPTGVVALCAQGPDGPVGMAVNSFTSVSLHPPVLSVCVDRASTTWPRLRTSPRLGISVLGAGQAGAARGLAARVGDRFTGVSRWTTDGGAVLLDDGCAWFEVSVREEVEVGDHTLVLLDVHGHRLLPEVDPLLFWRSGYPALRPLSTSGQSRA